MAGHDKSEARSEPSDTETGEDQLSECRESLLHKVNGVIEFYFSDINLSRNQYFAHKVLEDPYVPIDLLMTFHKLKELTDSKEVILDAIKMSKMLHVTPDGKKIYRTTEIQLVDQIEEHVIYVENVPENKDIEWLRQIFSSYGQVVYVSLPVFKKTRMNKGYAFIELASEKDVAKAYEAFKSTDLLICTNMPPEELLSIKTHETDNPADAPEVDRMKLVNSTVESRDLAKLGMKVMMKCDWRRLRNRYLNRLHVQNRTLKEESGAQEEECTYKKGLIVKLQKSKHLGNLAQYIEGIRLRPNGGVVFVTNHAKSDFVYIRFASAEQADALLSSDAPHITKLEGSEEVEYWENVTKIVAEKKERAFLKKIMKKKEKRLAKAQNQAGSVSDISEHGNTMDNFDNLVQNLQASVAEDQPVVDPSLRSKRKKKRDRKTGHKQPANKHIYFEDYDEAKETNGEVGMQDPKSEKGKNKREADLGSNGEEPSLKKACLRETEA
ncbi:Hypothetical predicted protein [Cloeon dipterum]|uniref:La-related protein 7 n=1 Tax=Cloeon dipterum TaxID=197152 RepID=A0A8S1BU05_9INSE|nr:Hypothetical predicted protein [Cloeon dipterum]